MTRSPLFYPLNRGTDADSGGVADLQTDVMRFMAILSLCLVAIFALVQSIPLAPTHEPVAPTPTAADALPATNPDKAQPVAKAVTEAPITLTRPAPAKAVQREAPPVLERPRIERVDKVETAPARQGFTLRFEDEAALTRLVARDEVGLYAILPGMSYRMNVNRGEFNFWPASMPKQFHEMDDTTVPAPVIDAFRGKSGAQAAQLKWGVTIPLATSKRLEQYLREETGGDLVIDARGELRLE